MEIDSLRDMLAVQRYASFAKASTERGLAQSTLSKHIAACEAELGIRLFERDSLSTAPTSLGASFLKTAGKIVRLYDDELKRIAELKRDVPQSMVVASYQGRRPTDDLISTVLFDLHATNPLLEVRVCDLRYASPTQAVLAGDADVAELLSASGSAFDKELEGLTLYTEPVIAVVPKTHRLAGRREIGIGELEGETLWVSSDPQFAELWHADLDLLGRFNCKVGISYDSAPCMAAALSLGFDHGVQLMASSQWFSSTPLPIRNRYAALSIAEEGFTLDVSFVWRRNCPNPAVATFIETAKTICSSTDFSLYW